ncbi:MAG: tetratricopeptide repeat protein [Rikenellaceae bacterium]
MRILKLTIIALLITLPGVVEASTPQFLKQGIELYNDGRWIDARLSLLKAKDHVEMGNSADAEDIDFYLAMCAIELDDPFAEQYMTNFEAQYPSSAYLNKIYFAKAMLLCSEEQFDQAKVLFEQVNYAPLTLAESEEYDMRMGYISFVDGDYSEAKEFFKNIKAKSDVYHHAQYYISYMEYIEGDNDAARSGFTELLKSDAYGAVAPFYLLQLDFNDGNYFRVLNDGEAIYKTATPERQQELVRTMAEAAFKLESYSKSISYLNQYRALGGLFGREESYMMGFSLYRQVRHVEAVDYLRSVCGADDALTQNASYHLADCYLQLNDKLSASKSFALASNENFDTEIAEAALFNYAKLQYELGDDRFNETINTLTRYLNRYPEQGDRYNQIKELLVASYYNSRNYDAAYQSIKELKNPDADIRLALQRISLYRGLDSYNKGDLQSAIAQIEESLAVSISPKYSSIARFYLGEINYANGDYQQADKDYTAYIITAPNTDANYTMALYNLAYVKYMLDNDTEALGYYQRFIESTPKDTFYRADAYNRKGDIFYSKREFAEAKAMYKHATWSTFDPRYYAFYQTAIIDGVIGDYRSKIDRLNSVISIGKGSYIEASMYELGRSYIAASEYEKGVDTHKRFITEYPSSDKYAQALSDLGLAYLNLNDKSMALSYYDKAIKAAPQSSIAKDALQGVREIYINDGDADGYFDYAASIGYSGDLDGMMRDSLSFTSAQRLYLNDEGRSQEAIHSLTDYIENYPHGYYEVDALFYLSDSYIKTGQNSDAIETLVQLTQRGSSQYTERVYDRLSSLTYAEKLYSQSAAAYLELYELSLKSDIRAKALAGYVDATVMEGDNRQITQMADYVMRQPSVDAKLLIKVKFANAKSLYARGEKQSALSTFKELSQDPLSREGAESLYIVIENQFNSGDLDATEKMILDFSKTDTPHLDCLARSFILLGDIYVSRGDSFQARATYQSIIDGYVGDGDNIVELARNRINNLQ